MDEQQVINIIEAYFLENVNKVKTSDLPASTNTDGLNILGVRVGETVRVAFETFIQQILKDKQNSLDGDGTGKKFPTVDAVNTGISVLNQAISKAVNGLETAITELPTVESTEYSDINYSEI